METNETRETPFFLKKQKVSRKTFILKDGSQTNGMVFHLEMQKPG